MNELFSNFVVHIQDYVVCAWMSEEHGSEEKVSEEVGRRNAIWGPTWREWVPAGP